MWWWWGYCFPQLLYCMWQRSPVQSCNDKETQHPHTTHHHYHLSPIPGGKKKTKEKDPELGQQGQAPQYVIWYLRSSPWTPVTIRQLWGTHPSTQWRRSRVPVTPWSPWACSRCERGGPSQHSPTPGRGKRS